MDQPIKIIHKYKNIHKKIQYNVLIFVGDLISEQTNKILKKIKDKNLYDTLTELNERDIEILNKEYGSKWYKYFFINKHINFTFDKIIKPNEQKKQEIIKKYGKEWYEDNVEKFTFASKTIYSYQTLFKYDKESKLKNIKAKSVIKDVDNLSYKTTLSSPQITVPESTNIVGGSPQITVPESTNIVSGSPQITVPESTNIVGGSPNENLVKINFADILRNKSFEPSLNNITNSNINNVNESTTSQNNIESDEINLESLEKMSEPQNQNLNEKQDTIDVNVVDEYNIDEIEKISKEDVTYDKDVDNVNKSLQQIIDKTEIEEKETTYGQIVPWNDIKDNYTYDEDLYNVYTKTYIYNQYICHDDTIKIIKNKICCGYGKSKLFESFSPYFIPSRIYLWSEYLYYDVNNILKSDKLMLGQKWIRRNELLDIDVEPNENIRAYETLKGNLKSLQENIKKYASRITYENDEHVILSDYFDFITNNEIFMLDIYNDLGIGYQISNESIKNLYDVYIKIYYFGLSQEDLNNIIDYLNIKNKTESKSTEGLKINIVYKNIQNDLLAENEILKTIEDLKKTPYLYNKIFKENFITQSVIHINIKHQNLKNSQKIELYRIFDNFIPTEKYPFIQYQTQDGQIVFKHFSLDIETDKENIIPKWFENSPYGISFKINVNQKGGSDNKYIAISLNDNGRMDYKTQWKEEDQATIDDVKKSYDEVRALLRKINQENNKLKVEIPVDDKFKFAFINTIQQFELPEKFLISHNDLSDFCRYFYPYIAVVIEPRKRQSKILKKNEKSKYGTYLRYKRISKYENEASLEKRIIYFLRNFEFNERLLSLEISKQFNITEKQSLDKINYVIEKYPNLKKSRNILKKFENIPKYKPPGIGIDIQGKQRNKYKMRISGARSKTQLDTIIEFMNILIYLYIETYLYKRHDRQLLREKLKTLSNIAKRRNKVEDILESTESVKTVKQITKLDKERLGYKPEKGQNQWTRNCQNSGDTKKRRPAPYTDKNIEQLIKTGYVYNTDSGEYEKKINVKSGSKNKSVTLKAAKIENYDGAGSSIYYTCDPKENGEYMYVGFLTRSANPFGLCMPCCFKKDPAVSKNKEKKDFHMRCLNKLTGDIKTKKLVGDRLYILQDTNKIQDGRFGYLPEYLDMYLNTMLNKDKTIKNSYLTASNNGWFFKYGSKQDDDIFLTAIGNALDLSVQQIKDKITESLIKNKNAESIFASLNNGDIKTQFGTISSYIRFLHTNFEIEYNTVCDILSIPSVIHDYGVNVIIFDKKSQFIKETEKKTMNDDYNIVCTNTENLHYFLNTNKINIIIMREDNNYYPIYQIRKIENSKNIDIDKYFKFDTIENNVINHIYQFIKVNYSQSGIESLKIDDAKTTYMKLEKYDFKNQIPTKQIIDRRNKCKYFVVQNKYLIPVKPSGSLFWLPIEYDYLPYVNDINSTADFVYNLYIKSNKDISVKPCGIYYSDKINNNYTINALVIDHNINIPVRQIILQYNDIINFAKKYKIKEFLTESKSIYDVIDQTLIKYDSITTPIDIRGLEVNKEKYYQESYELFRLELAYYLKDQSKLREKIIKLISNEKYDKSDKSKEIKKILFKLISKKLFDLYIETESSVDNYADDHVIETSIDEKIIDDTSEYLDDSDLIPINIVESISSEKQPNQTGGKKQKNKPVVIPVNKSENKSENKQIVTDPDIDNLQMFVNQNRRLVHINNQEPDLSNYVIKNNREICPTNTKNMCNKNPHCQWQSGTCLFRTSTTKIIEFVNKISEELTNNDLKSHELTSRENYFVSDIVNKDYYTTRPNQKIIKSNNNNIKKILSELFGKNNVPIIGRRKMNKISKNINETNIQNPLETIGDRMYQIVHFNNQIYRAYANCYFWLKNTLMDISHRNLGYYSPLQTDLSNYFKSQVIDWIVNKKNQQVLINDFTSVTNINKNTFITEIKKYLATNSEAFKSYIVEIYILSKINNYAVYLYDNFDNIIGIFDDGIVYLSNYFEKINKNTYASKNPKIQIKYNVSSFSFTNTPSAISSIYI